MDSKTRTAMNNNASSSFNNDPSKMAMATQTFISRSIEDSLSIHSNSHNNFSTSPFDISPSLGESKSETMVGMKSACSSSWLEPTTSSKSNRLGSRIQKKVSFSSLVTVNTILSSILQHDDTLHHISTFEKQRHKEMTRIKDDRNSTQDKSISLINSDGRVCRERRMHQQTAIMAVISYQKRLQTQIKSAPVSCSSKFALLLAPVSLKLSQRARDIALESARQTYLEVYPESSWNQNHHANNMKNMLVPINISEFPVIKKKRKDVSPSPEAKSGGKFGCIAQQPSPKRSRNEYSVQSSMHATSA